MTNQTESQRLAEEYAETRVGETFVDSQYTAIMNAKAGFLAGRASLEKRCEELEAGLREATKGLVYVCEANCPTYMAHPQTVWWIEHVQSSAKKLLPKLQKLIGEG